MFQSYQDDEKGANGKVFATEKYCLRFKRFTLSAFYFFGNPEINLLRPGFLSVLLTF